MRKLTSIAGATAAVYDPTTSPAALAVIVRNHPSLHALVAQHPNVYPDLVDWLRRYGSDDARRLLAQPAAGPAASQAPAAGPTPSQAPAAGPTPSQAPAAGPVAGAAPELPARAQPAPARSNGKPSRRLDAPAAHAQEPSQATPRPPAARQPSYVQPSYVEPSDVEPQGAPGRPAPRVLGAGAVAAALILAGVTFGVPGTGFHGVLPRGGPSTPPVTTSPPAGSPSDTQSSPGVSSTAPSSQNRYQTTWTLPASGLGLDEAKLTAAGETATSVNLVSPAQTDTIWLVQAQGGNTMANLGLFGVDAAAGTVKWGPVLANVPKLVCTGRPINGVFFCGHDGAIYSINAKTGRNGRVVRVFQAGTVRTTTGTADLPGTFGENDFQLDAVGDYLVARYRGNPALVSLVSTTGKVMWSSSEVDFTACGGRPQFDAVTGSALLLNDCGNRVFDVKTGALLYSAKGMLGFVDDHTMWGSTAEGALSTDGFSSSDGTMWTVYRRPGQDAVSAEAATVFSPQSSPVAPIAVADDNASVQWWQSGQTSPSWTATLDRAGFASAAYDRRHLILLAGDGTAVGLSPQTGKVAWQAKLPGQSNVQFPPTGVFLGDGQTAVASFGDATVVFSADTGEVYGVWTPTGDGPDVWSPSPEAATSAMIATRSAGPAGAESSLARLDIA